MNEIVAAVNDRKKIRRDLEELLLTRDALRKKAKSFEIAYLREFGELLRQNLEVKIECIKKKKTLGFCRQFVNAGKSIDSEAVKRQIELEMKAYYYEMAEMVRMNEVAKHADRASKSDYELSKSIYRRLARLIHPDLNPGLRENEVLTELWDRITEAYHFNDCEELEKLEVLVHHEIESDGNYTEQIGLSEMERLVNRVEYEISSITANEPYVYIKDLESDEVIDKKKSELKAEQEEYKKYSKELSDEIDALVEGGVKLLWRL